MPIYPMIALIVFAIVMLLGISYGLFNLVLFINTWLHDDKEFKHAYPEFIKELPIYDTCDWWDSFKWSDILITSILIPFIYGATLGCGWGIFVLAGIVYVPLYYLRGLIRFKTKLDKAMYNSNKENHTHDWEE